MAGELVVEAVGGIVRAVVSLLVEVLFEFGVRGTGRVLLRLRRRQEEPDEATCIVAGLAFWALPLLLWLAFAGL